MKTSDEIKLPDSPKQGDVVEWWTMQNHPVSSYVQHHRATYYEEAACNAVLGKDYKGGRPFQREWHVETWYEPEGSKTQGGRNTTDGMKHYLTVGPDGGSVHATWEGARDATVENMRERAHEFKSMAMRLERAAMALAESSTPKAVL